MSFVVTFSGSVENLIAALVVIQILSYAVDLYNEYLFSRGKWNESRAVVGGLEGSP